MQHRASAGLHPERGGTAQPRVAAAHPGEVVFGLLLPPWKGGTSVRSDVVPPLQGGTWAVGGSQGALPRPHRNQVKQKSKRLTSLSNSKVPGLERLFRRQVL